MIRENRDQSSHPNSPRPGDEHPSDWIVKPYSIVLSAFILFVLIFVITLFLGWRQFEERKMITLTDDKTTASLLTYIIKERNKATIEILQSYAHRPLFVAAVKNKDVAGVHRHMSDLKKNAEIDLTFVTDKRGFLWANFPIFPEAIGKDLSSRDWYKGISSHWNPYISTVFKLIIGDKPLAAAYCVPIFDGKEMVVGVLATSQRLDFLEDINQRLPLDPNIKVSITDQKGQILYSNNYSYKGNITDYRFFPIVEQALKAKKQQLEISDPQGDQEKIYLTVVPVIDFGWSVIIERPLKDIYSFVIKSFIGMGVISFLLFLLIVSFMVYLRKVLLSRKTVELLQAEVKLRQGEERHRNILKTAMDGFWAVDMQGRLLEVNDAYCRMSGYSAQELLTMRIPDLEVAEADDDTAAHIQKIMAQGEDRFESLHHRKDGSIFDVEVSVQHQPVGGGRFVVFLQDITDRKRTEEALLNERNLIASIMETSPVGITTVDFMGRINFANSKAIAILGLSKDEISQTTYNAPKWHISDLDGKPFPDDLLPFNIVMSTGKSVLDVQHAIQWPDGKRILLSINGAPMIDASGKVIGMVASIEDITARKQTEENYRMLFREMLDGFALHEIICDGEGNPTDYRFRSINPAFEQMTGLKEKEIVGRTVLDVLPSIERNWIGIYGKVALTGEPAVFESYSAELKKHFAVTAFRPAPKQFACIFADITERKKAEEEQAKLEAQLQQAQKMESVGRLAGGVAHDFNNMLGLIIGHAELALERVDPTHPLQTDLQEIRKAAERSANLTRQLLAFARKQTIEPKVLDLNETVESMLRMLQRLIGEDIELKWQPEANLWPVKIDPSQLDQTLANLCVNSRDAISGVGKLTIETANTSFDEDYSATHAGFVPGEYVRLTVSDSGCGMDKETLLHLFEPFFTTKGMGKGTGLGLAMVYGIVKQNRGFINVYSEPEQGTAFTIYLPRHLGETEKTLPQGKHEPALRGQETILLVEDEPDILSLTMMLLERQGYTVLAASTPNEALRLAQEYVGEIHLLMTDVVMPEMNGRDLAKTLLDLYPHLKRLFTSGYTADVIAHHGVLDEGVHFIQKPFSIRSLAAKVRDALDS